VSLYILLPPFTPNALDETISRLNASSLESAMSGMVEDTIELHLPKFKIDETYELSESLRTLGITKLFSEDADLTDFSSKPGLHFSSGIHKAFLEVDEEGATAAAATSLIRSRSGHIFNDSKFKCNHPFVFFVYDKQAKEVLFIGAFRGPNRGGQEAAAFSIKKN
jgi:serine protease inhibitor